jgi:hypothetical protein
MIRSGFVAALVFVASVQAQTFEDVRRELGFGKSDTAKENGKGPATSGDKKAGMRALKCPTGMTLTDDVCACNTSGQGFMKKPVDACVDCSSYSGWILGSYGFCECDAASGYVYHKFAETCVLCVGDAAINTNGKCDCKSSRQFWTQDGSCDCVDSLATGTSCDAPSNMVWLSEVLLPQEKAMVKKMDMLICNTGYKWDSATDTCVAANCGDGSVWHRGDCLECGDGCKTCGTEPFSCQTCNEGYTLTTTTKEGKEG